MKTSLIIPFKNEEEYADLTMRRAYNYLSERSLSFELVAVDDSSDNTWKILQDFSENRPNVIVVKGASPPGYGKAIRRGIDASSGDIVIPFNGDLSDSLDDVLRYIQLISQEGYDMAFGSRFMEGADVEESTGTKELVSRLGNAFLQTLFDADCSDITNSFKAYRREVLEEVKPRSDSYSIGMEIALKGIKNRYRYTTIPIAWTGRQYGKSKMSIARTIPQYLLTAFGIRFLGDVTFRMAKKSTKIKFKL